MQTETVDILTAGTTTDPYSAQTVEDWTTPTEVTVTTLAPAEPRPSSEPGQVARNSVTSGWTLYLPETSGVTARNRIRVRGVVYPVLGQPASWMGAGIVVQCSLTEG